MDGHESSAVLPQRSSPKRIPTTAGSDSRGSERLTLSAPSTAWVPLPPEMGSGGVNFVSQTDQRCGLVCSGADPAPWSQHQPSQPPVGGSGGFVRLRSDRSSWVRAESAMLVEIADDQDHLCDLQFVSSGASSRGQKRQRWDLRTLRGPTPTDDVQSLRASRPPHGPITARPCHRLGAGLHGTGRPRMERGRVLPGRPALQPCVASLCPIRNGCWPVIGHRLCMPAVDAIRADHPLVVAVAAVDDATGMAARAGQEPTLAGLDSPTWSRFVRTRRRLR